MGSIPIPKQKSEEQMKAYSKLRRNLYIIGRNRIGEIDMQMTLEDIKHDPDDIYVRRITYDETKPFLLNIHYARRMPCITDAFALVRGGEQ
jgi:hypothetical protein